MSASQATITGGFSVSFAKRTSPTQSTAAFSSPKGIAVAGDIVKTPTGAAQTQAALRNDDTPSPHPLFPGAVSLSPNTTTVLNQHRRRTNHSGTPTGTTNPTLAVVGGIQAPIGQRTLFARPVTVGGGGLSGSPVGAAEDSHHHQHRSQSGAAAIIHSSAPSHGGSGVRVGSTAHTANINNLPSTRPPSAVASLLNNSSSVTHNNSAILNGSFADAASAEMLRPPSANGPRTAVFAGKYSSTRGGLLNASTTSSTVQIVDLRPSTSTPSSTAAVPDSRKSPLSATSASGSTTLKYSSPEDGRRAEAALLAGDATPTHRQSSVSSTGSRNSGMKRSRRPTLADGSTADVMRLGASPSSPDDQRPTATGEQEVSPIPRCGTGGTTGGGGNSRNESGASREYVEGRCVADDSEPRDKRSTSTTYTVRGLIDGMRIQRSSSTAWGADDRSLSRAANGPSSGKDPLPSRREHNRPAPLDGSEFTGKHLLTVDEAEATDEDEEGGTVRRRPPRVDTSSASVGHSTSDAMEIGYGGMSPSVSQSRRAAGGVGGRARAVTGQRAQYVDPTMSHVEGTTTTTTASSGVSSPSFHTGSLMAHAESPSDSIGMRQYVTFGSSFHSSKEVSPTAHTSRRRASRRHSVASIGHADDSNSGGKGLPPFTSALFSQDVQDSQASSTGGFVINTNIDSYNAHNQQHRGEKERSSSRQPPASGRPPKSDVPSTGPRHRKGSEVNSHASPAFQRPSLGSTAIHPSSLQGGSYQWTRASTASSSFLNVPPSFHRGLGGGPTTSLSGTLYEGADGDHDSSSVGGGDQGVTAYFAHKFHMEFNDIQVLGKGSFGKVMLAEEVSTGHYFAVKLSAPIESARQEHKLKQERNILFALRGTPHCMTVHDAWIEGAKDQPQLYLQTAWYERGSLGKMISNRRETDTHWKEEEVLCFLGQMAIALEAIHAVNIVHVDFKPDNVLVDADYNFHLGDFGCALVLGDESQRPYSLKNNFLVAASQQRPSGEMRPHGGMHFGMDHHPHTNMGPPPATTATAGGNHHTPHSPTPSMHPRAHHATTVFSTPSCPPLRTSGNGGLPAHLLNNPHIGALPTASANPRASAELFQGREYFANDSDSVNERDSGASVSVSVCSHDAGDGRYTATDMQNDKLHYKAGDMFSFGMSLYEMMSGRDPPRDRAHYEIRHRTDLNELLERGYSPALVSLVLSMLNPDPLARPTARDVLQFSMLSPSSRTAEVMQGAAKLLQGIPHVLPVSHAKTHLPPPSARTVQAVSAMNASLGGFMHGSESVMGLFDANGRSATNNVPASACATPLLGPVATPREAHERRLAFTNAGSTISRTNDAGRQTAKVTSEESGDDTINRGLAGAFSSSVDEAQRHRSATAESRPRGSTSQQRPGSTPMPAQFRSNGDSPDILASTMGSAQLHRQQHPPESSPYVFSRPPPLHALGGAGDPTNAHTNQFSSPPINTARTAIGGSSYSPSGPHNPCDDTLQPYYLTSNQASPNSAYDHTAESPNVGDVSAVTHQGGANGTHLAEGSDSGGGSTESTSDSEQDSDDDDLDVYSVVGKAATFGKANLINEDGSPMTPLDSLLTPYERVELRYHRTCLEVAQYNLGLLNRAVEGVVPPARMRYIRWHHERAEEKKRRRLARKGNVRDPMRGGNEAGNRTPCTMGQRLFRSSSDVRITPTASGTLFGAASGARWGSDSFDVASGRGTLLGSIMTNGDHSHATQNMGITFTDEASPTIRRPGGHHHHTSFFGDESPHRPHRN